jgi:hypothetical protein
MTRAWAGLLVCVLAVGLVVGCSRSKEDLIQKSRGVGTRANLERALGKPSDISKLGPAEQWTVVFLIVGDTVTMQATMSPDEKKKDQK